MSHVETIAETTEFEAPASAVWELLIDWAAIIDWMPDGYVQSLELEGKGPGAIRHLVTLKGINLSERLDAMNEAAGILELSLVEPMPWGLLSYHARGKLEDTYPGKCHLSWQGTLKMPGRGPEYDKVVNLLRKSYAKMFEGIRRVVEA